MNKSDLGEIIKETLLGLTISGTIITLVVLANIQHKKKENAYEEALRNYKPVHRILIGDEGVNTVSQVADMMNVYADINGKKVEVPLSMRLEYLARENDLETSENKWKVEQGQELRY